MAGALVLNASYEPLVVVPLRRAVILVLTEKADLVAAKDGQTWRSVDHSVDVPAVIRLRRYVRVPYRHGPGRPTLRGLIARDGKTCAYCGKHKAESIDHVLPKSRGGGHTWENTVAACKRCNNRKADRTPQEAGMRLRVTPTCPPGGAWLIVAVADRDPAWDEWLTPLAVSA